ncbi:MAG: two-component regulator propeller domain-containing protein [Breznakibacter sp.]
MKKILTTIAMVWGLLALNQAQQRFQHFGIDNGLSNNSVRVMFQDQQGFLWIGTLNGFNRFDGYNFKEFLYRPNDTTSIHNNRITHIMQDSRGMFYLTTFDGGMHQFNHGTEVFKAIIPNSLLSGQSFNCLYVYQSSPDVFWFLSSNNGCARIVSSPKYKNGFHLDHFNRAGGTLPGDTVNFVYKASDNSVWIGTSQGMVRIDNDTVEIPKNTFISKGKDFTYVHETNAQLWFGTRRHGVAYANLADKQLRTPNLTPIMNDQILVINSDNTGHVAIGTGNNGLVWIDTHTLDAQYFNRNNSRFNSNRVNNIFRDSKGLFWLVTNDRGVTAFRSSDFSFKYHGLNARERASLAENDQQLFFEDSNGDLWIGIYGGGLCKYVRDKETFEQYTNDSKNPFSIASDYVLSLYEDRSRNLWIGHYNGGLSKINLKPTHFKHVAITNDFRQSFQNEVRSLLQDNSGNILVGTKGGEVLKNSNQLKLENNVQTTADFALKGFDKAVYCLFEDAESNLWIGTKGNGLFVVRHADRNKPNPPYFHLKQSTATEFSADGNKVYDIKQDIYGQYWIATYAGGLYLLKDPFGNPEFTNFHFEPGSPWSLSDNRLRQLLFDHENNLWIATSGGLNLLPFKYLNSKEKKFTRIVNVPGANENISNNDVNYMALHPNGKLYLGTFGGGLNILDKADVDKGIFEWRHVMKRNGLSSNVIHSIQVDNTGMMWLATDNGLNRFNPEDETVELFYEHDGLGANLFSEAACLKTRNGDLIFGHTKGLVAFNPLQIRKDSTQYKICITNLSVNNQDFAAGGMLDKTFDYLHNNITFEFATLDLKSPEKHNYSFILEEFDPEWSKPNSLNRVSYRGLPPGKYTFKVKGTNSDGIWMGEMASFSFTIKPPFWNSPWGYFLMSASIVGLIVAFYYLKLQQVKLQHELKYNDQLNEQKIRYYTNISHEFKTPLTLILNPTLEIMESRTASEPVKEKAREIQRNANYLLHLIEQILDFRRIREDKAQLQVCKVNLVEFMREMHMVFVPLAKKKEIDLNFSSNIEDYEGYADVRYLEKICYNLISNAIKHTPRKKKIHIEVCIDEAKKIFSFTVCDEGVGIEQKELSRIFERFYRSTDSSGIGLFFTRELVAQHGGEIKATSEAGKGASFAVSIPVAENNYTAEQVRDQKGNRSFDLKPSEEVEMAYNIYPEEVNMPAKKTSSQKESVLVIEDNPSLLSFLMEKLGEKFNVGGAINGKEGLKAVKEGNFDLVVCDYMMPEMDGMETLKRLKTDMGTSTIPVIVLTAISNEEKVAEAFELGADDYITKPFNINHLSIRIENLITQRKRLKQSFTHEPEFSKDDLPGANTDKEFIDQVTKIVDENIGNIDFSVDYIADKMGLSRTVFYKKMKQISGYSPNEFIQLIRMKKAAFLIKNSNIPIADIALRVGFNDSNYFSKCFKSHYGVPPSTYQKQS